MKRLIRNPWTWLLLGPGVLFTALIVFHVPSDLVLLTFGFLLFLVISVAASKYAFRAPALIWQGNMSNEAINIIGWSCVLLALMATQTFRWIFISLDRPDWLIETYWNASFTYTMFFGFCLVAWSTRKTMPRQPGERLGLGGFFVGFLTALGLMLSGILPSLTKLVVAFFGGLLRGAV